MTEEQLIFAQIQIILYFLKAGILSVNKDLLKYIL